MRITGYVYGGELSCPDCTKVDYEGGLIKVDRSQEPYTDEHGLPLMVWGDLKEEVGVIFDTTEGQYRGEYCDGCGDIISEPWLAEGYKVVFIEEEDLVSGPLFHAGEYEPGWYWLEEGDEVPLEPDGTNGTGPYPSEESAVFWCAVANEVYL